MIADWVVIYAILFVAAAAVAGCAPNRLTADRQSGAVASQNANMSCSSPGSIAARSLIQ